MLYRISSNFCISQSVKTSFHPVNFIPIVCKLWELKDVSISVSFYHVAPESHVKLNHCCPVVLQLVWQCVFDLYWNCKEQKHFKLSNFRYRRRSLFKRILVAVCVAISLHHQYCDHLCEIQQKVLSGMQHCASFFRARRWWPLQVCWLLGLLIWHTLFVLFRLMWTPEHAV